MQRDAKLILFLSASAWLGSCATEQPPTPLRLGEDYEQRYLGRLLGEPTMSRRRPPVDEQGPPPSPRAEAARQAEPRSAEARAPRDPEPHAAREPSPPPGIPREDVRKVIGSHYPEIQGCYEKMLAKNPKFKGRLVLKFLV